MTRREELENRKESLRERRALALALSQYELTDLVSGLDSATFGAEARSLEQRAESRSAVAFRRGVVMPDGFTLTVCYGEAALLQRIPAWSQSVHPDCHYWVRLHPIVIPSSDVRGSPAGLLAVSGVALRGVIERLSNRRVWPEAMFWLERTSGGGMYFDEFAGTPQIEGSDDIRIFEVTAWHR